MSHVPGCRRADLHCARAVRAAGAAPRGWAVPRAGTARAENRAITRN